MFFESQLERNYLAPSDRWKPNACAVNANAALVTAIGDSPDKAK